ncbi:hypothetical protein V6N13_049439 [Hibiscus sabdariffa]|uniref:Uncharacterized protein n=1 Tax=Hibiscus sabdariffa TaxID=183260 RepID=A0ABR2QXA0_9ROSI
MIDVVLRDGFIVVVRVIVSWLSHCCSTYKIFGHSDKFCTVKARPEKFAQMWKVKEAGNVLEMGEMSKTLVVNVQVCGDAKNTYDAMECKHGCVEAVIGEPIVVSGKSILPDVGSRIDLGMHVASDLVEIEFHSLRDSMKKKGKGRGINKNCATSSSNKIVDIDEDRKPRTAS